MTSQKKETLALTDEQVIENADIADGMADSTPDGGNRPNSSKPRLIPTDEIIVNEEEEYPRN